MEIEGIASPDWDREDWDISLPINDHITSFAVSRINCPCVSKSSSLKRPFSHLVLPHYFEGGWGSLLLGSYESRDVCFMRPLTTHARFDQLATCHKNFFEKCAHKVKKVGKAIAKGAKKTGKVIAEGAKKVAHEVKEFVQEHKTEIIVVAAAVATVAIVAGVVALTTAATAKATAEAATAVVVAAAASKKKEEDSPSGSNTPNPDLFSETRSSLSSAETLSPTTFNYPFISFDPSPLPTTPAPSTLTSDNRPPQQFNFNQPPLETYPWKPHFDSGLKETQSINFSQPFIPPITTNPLPSSEPKKVPSPLAFIDPDGPVRVHNLPPPTPLRSTTFEIPGLPLARGAIGGINGIGNSIEDAKAHAEYLSQISHHNIQWVHNCSHSTPVDVAETILLNFHGISAPSKLLEENWIKFHEQHKNDPSAKYLQISHSQGTVHVEITLLRVPQHIRDRIISVAFGPARIIPKGLCFKAFNYASKRDPVPYAEASLYAGSDDPLIRELATQKLEELKKELILLEPHPDAPLFDHGLESPTLRESMEQHMKDYIKIYGTPQ